MGRDKCRRLQVAPIIHPDAGKAKKKSTRSAALRILLCFWYGAAARV
jgi:hypothetical protein